MHVSVPSPLFLFLVQIVFKPSILFAGRALKKCNERIFWVVWEARGGEQDAGHVYNPVSFMKYV